MSKPKCCRRRHVFVESSIVKQRFAAHTPSKLAVCSRICHQTAIRIDVGINKQTIALLLLVAPLIVCARADELDSFRRMPTARPTATSTQFVQPIDRYWPDKEATFAKYDDIYPGNFDAVSLNPSGSNTAEPWTWQVLPQGLIFRSFLAGGREPRLSAEWVHVKGWGWLWNSSLGARIGILRYGTRNPLAPQGWEIDAEGAAFPRLTLDSQRDMISSDFRFGFPLTYRRDRWQFKLAFYHLSSHLADEYILLHPRRRRINYSRDALTFAVGFFPRPSWRLYAECGWAWYADGGSEPWEFQFGIEYSPLYPNGLKGTPFFAINTRLREEVDYGGNMTVQAGWQWRGWSGQRFRMGLQYFNGMSDQYQFFREFEQQIGLGLWYDF